MFIDVKKAHLNGKVQEGEYAFVRLPDGKFGSSSVKGVCGFAFLRNTHAHLCYETQNEGNGTRA